MLLAIDIGNSETTWGLFSGDRLKARWSTATAVQRTVDEHRIMLDNLLRERGLGPAEIKESAVCSVVPPLTAVFEQMIGQKLAVEPLVVGAGVKTGIKIRMDNPREVGADRIVNAVAAHHLYDGPVIIIDMGTATTFDTLSATGEYLGGAIAPGLKTSMEALNNRTAVLPRIELVRPQKAIGTNTVAAMRSGMLFGYVGLVEGLVSRIQAELGQKATVVATGGLAKTIANETSVVDTVNPDLTLTGLRLVHRINREIKA